MPSRGRCCHVAPVACCSVFRDVHGHQLASVVYSHDFSDSLRSYARCWAVSISRLSIVMRIPLPWIRLPVFRSSSCLAKHFVCHLCADSLCRWIIVVVAIASPAARRHFL